MGMETNTTRTTPTDWELHGRHGNTVLHKKAHGNATIFRLRDEDGIMNDSFAVVVDGTVVGNRASLATARKLAESATA